MRYKFVSLRIEVVNGFRFFLVKNFSFKNGKGNETNQACIQVTFIVISILWISK